MVKYKYQPYNWFVHEKVKEEQEEVDGTVHFSEDEVFGHHIGSGVSGDRNLHGGDALHHDLETIEKELQKVYNM